MCIFYLLILWYSVGMVLECFVSFWYCVSIVLVFVCIVLGSVRFYFRNVLVWFRYVVGMVMFCFSVQFGLI